MKAVTKTELKHAALKWILAIAMVTSSGIAHAGGESCDPRMKPGEAAPAAAVNLPQAAVVADPAIQTAVAAIVNALPEEGKMTPAEIEPALVAPPKFDMGQIAFPCFPLAKKLRLAPQKIAENLAQTISADMPVGISKVEAAGGYLNFTLDFNAYAARVAAEIQSGAFFQPKFAAGQQPEKISIEFSQPNTHKALHVGHLRNMVLGESVARLLQAAGHTVVRDTYPGDMGAHIAKALWYITTQKKGVIPADGDPQTQAAWLGQMYAEADAFVKAKGKEYAATHAAAKPVASDDVDPNEAEPEVEAVDPAVKAQVGDVLRALEAKEEPLYSLYQQTREWSLAEMRRVYDWLGIRFDRWFFESTCEEPSRELVLNKAAEGFFQPSKGALGIDLSQYGLGFVLYLKSNGTGLYITKDLELLKEKFADGTVTRSIVVVDARQSLHFRQLFKTAELMGMPQATRSIHLAYETVTTADGTPFSSRTMNGMGLDDIRNSIEEKVGPQLATAVLKFGFLKADSNKQVRFDLDAWMKNDGDGVVSLINLYKGAVRELAAAGGPEAGAPAPGAAMDVTTEAEKQLLNQLRLFPKVVATAARDLRPTAITIYLTELGKNIERFNAECPRGADVPAQIRATRLAIVKASSAVMKKGLSLLGIDNIEPS